MTKAAPRLQLQARDLEVLQGLFESRLMTLAHAAALHFEGRVEAAKKRIQKLKEAGFISERPRRAYEPSILHLATDGFAALRDRGTLDRYPESAQGNLKKRATVSASTLNHELQVMDTKSAFASSLRGVPGLSLESFITWPLLLAFSAERPDGYCVTVKPDGFIQIIQRDIGGDASRYRFFLEVDCGTETQETLSIRAACYRHYYRSGAFAERCGGSRREPERFPFRVLFVFPNTERRNNAAERMLLLAEPIGSQVCLTTASDVQNDPLGDIWITPKMYESATTSTPHDVTARAQTTSYARNIDRERFIDECVHKSSILD